MTEDRPKTSDELAQARTDLALKRTLMSADRSLMAWIRTSLSMIGFGFTIYKFFQYMSEEVAAGALRRPQAARNLGLTLIGLGTLSLAAAVLQHRNFMIAMGATQPRQIWSIAFVMALVVVVVGGVTFYGILLHTGPF